MKLLDLLLCIYFLLCCGLGDLAHYRYRRSGVGFFLFGLLVSPLFGLVLLLLMGKRGEA